MTQHESVTWSHSYRSLPEHTFWSAVTPEPLANPKWVDRNETLIHQYGLEPWVQETHLEAYAAGTPLAEWLPLAQVYSGHQFGQWAGQLGDGRGLYLGVTHHPDGALEWHLKGAGQTPYSRFGDGRAVLRSTLREYLGSEYLAALDIPTTRGLSVVTSETPVQRESLETAATLVRLAKSHLRIGHLEHFHHRGDTASLNQLIEFSIQQLDPELMDRPDRVELFFERVMERSAKLVAEWMAVGFVHGVMNTDNTALSGETLDYGPYGFLTHYDPDYVINHTDQGGRYAYGQQPRVMQWNLACLAETLVEHVAIERLQQLIQAFPVRYQAAYHHSMARRFGFSVENTALADLLKWQQTLFAEDGTYYPESFAMIAGFEGHYLSHRAIDTRGLEEAQDLWRREHEPLLQRQQQQITPAWMLSHWLLARVIEEAETGDFESVRGIREATAGDLSVQTPLLVSLNNGPPVTDDFELSCSS